MATNLPHETEAQCKPIHQSASPSVSRNQMAPKTILVEKNMGETSKNDENKMLSPIANAITALVTLTAWIIAAGINRCVFVARWFHVLHFCGIFNSFRKVNEMYPTPRGSCTNRQIRSCSVAETDRWWYFEISRPPLIPVCRFQHPVLKFVTSHCHCRYPYLVPAMLYNASRME